VRAAGKAVNKVSDEKTGIDLKYLADSSYKLAKALIEQEPEAGPKTLEVIKGLIECTLVTRELIEYQKQRESKPWIDEGEA
jgi:hypothetical protein